MNLVTVDQTFPDPAQPTARGFDFYQKFIKAMGILLYSHAALRSRLAKNTFAKGDQIDLSGPVIRLENLSAEDFYVLLGNIRTIFAGGS